MRKRWWLREGSVYITVIKVNINIQGDQGKLNIFQLNMHIFKYRMEDWLTNKRNKKFQQWPVQISESYRFVKHCLEIIIILIAITLKHWLKISIMFYNMSKILHNDVVNNSLFVNYRMCSQLTELDSLLADLNSFR